MVWNATTVAWAVLTGMGFLAAVSFVALYARSRGWWRSALGQNLMAKTGVLAALLGLSLASMLWRLPAWIWLGGMGTLDVIMWWRVAILWRLQHREGR